MDPSTLGDVTLVVWDQEVRGSQNDALVALNEAFQARYPNIKIERTSQSTDDLKTQVTLALSGASTYGGGTTIACGQSRSAWATFMAERTPKRRAS